MILQRWLYDSDDYLDWFTKGTVYNVLYTDDGQSVESDNGLYRTINDSFFDERFSRVYKFNRGMDVPLKDESGIGTTTPLNKIEVNDEEVVEPNNDNTSRVFDSGASRNSDEGKLDFDGFLSPLVLDEFAVYMNDMRYLEDGCLRDSDNWKKGIPKEQYIKSMFRHFMEVWKNQTYGNFDDIKRRDLCALLFNVMGLLHEELKKDFNN